jgi:two-component system, NtrC family, sensor histidine kinase HydH
MRFRFGLGWQLALVLALFVTSLAAMLFSSWTALDLPRREEQARDHVRDASRQLAGAAAEVADQPLPDDPPTVHELDRQLRSITDRILRDTPGLEGGFYLQHQDGRGHFLGSAFPSGAGPEPRREPRPEPPPRDIGPEPPDNFPPDKRGPPGRHRRPPPPHDQPPPPELPPGGPPPKESRFILEQVKDCLTLPPGSPPSVQVRDVEPSRVAIAAEPIGDTRPARLAAWVMTRITSPEQQRDQLHRYQASAGLALGGFGLSAVLMGNLVRTLRRERQQRENLREELRRAENLASLGRLLAGVAHEVRNPLAALRSTVQLWQRLPDRARTPESMDAVVHSVDRLNDLVSRLLYFARSGHDARRSVDLNSLVREAIELMRAQADGQKVTLSADLDPNLPPLAGSAQALQQVVLNLTANALQAMPDGGRLEYRTRWLPGKDGAELRVRDTGPGVPADARARLFEPFFTTRAEGTGLGLALCREIVRQHGGSIELADTKEPGAEFVIRLTRGKLGEGQA